MGSNVLGDNVGDEVVGVYEGMPVGVNVDGLGVIDGAIDEVGGVESAGGFLLVAVACCSSGLFLFGLCFFVGLAVGERVVVVGMAVIEGAIDEGMKVGLSAAAIASDSSFSTTVIFSFTPSPPNPGILSVS